MSSVLKKAKRHINYDNVLSCDCDPKSNCCDVTPDLIDEIERLQDRVAELEGLLFEWCDAEDWQLHLSSMAEKAGSRRWQNLYKLFRKHYWTNEIRND